MPLAVVGRGQMSRFTGVWKKLIPTLTRDFEGFEACVEEVTVDMVERAANSSQKRGLKT